LLGFLVCVASDHVVAMSRDDDPKKEGTSATIMHEL
jgi:hypothetical protein